MGTLDPSAADKVKTVAKALIERPQLKIDVPIATVADVDGPALVDARFNAELGAAQAGGGGRKAASAVAAAGPVAFDQLGPTQQLELLTQVYRKDFGSEPKYPDEVTAIKDKLQLVSAKSDFLRKAVHDHIAVGDDDLKALGQQRAAAVQAALLADSQVTDDRVFLVANDKASEKDGAVRLELSLK